MLNIEIRRPKIEDNNELVTFFRTVITDTYIKESIGNKKEDIESEIETKKAYLESDFESNGEKRYFLIALYEDTIIGTIEFGPANELIRTGTNNDLTDICEVGTVFVHPNFQRMGVGNSLLTKVFKVLQKRGIEEFCLDSGYKSAQKIWTKKYGNPDYFLMNYWGDDNHHMIWRVNILKFLK